MPKKTVKHDVRCENCVCISYDEDSGAYGHPIARCTRTGKQIEQTETCKHAKSVFNNEDTRKLKKRRVKTLKDME
jgi:hypothetical protein